MKNYKTKVEKFFPQGATLGELLQKLSKLPADKVADAALKGAVWIQRESKGKILRIREVSERVKPQDTVSLFYDERVLKIKAPQDLICLEEFPQYGIWIKPAGVVTQGTQTGDHASIFRYVELKKKKEVYLVHRLDRETEGLLVIAYNSKASGSLSELFVKNEIKKTYQAVVLGSLTPGATRTIDASLDGKEAITHFKVLDSNESVSLLEVQIETGRLHQIRRHLDHIGHPVMGDPKYGEGNKNRTGLKLLAQSLSFKDPFDFKLKTWTSPHFLSL